ncbi:MAG: LysE family transporter [Gemmatimonadetes bacterium]|nr:LysE family transporter [Gemmatimonadota bacterium]MBT6147646.1 LysE family transporter [Gemmatimonadota bacterium]MBT7860045.1 LysE family transporter [Gemmatimonadota bacterium]
MIPFLLEAVVISLSGVMAPGPLSARTLSHGHRSPHAGAVVALGHGVVEFPLMALTLFGFGAILDVSGVRPGLLLAGGLVLAWMGVGMVRLARQGFDATVTDTGAGSPLWTGIALTGANPYFLVWWVTVGAALLVRAADFGAMGLLMFAIAHWLCDLGWLWFMSAAAFGGTRWLGARFSRIVHAVCGGFLLLAALDFLIDGTRQVMALFGNGGASL